MVEGPPRLRRRRRRKDGCFFGDVLLDSIMLGVETTVKLKKRKKEEEAEEGRYGWSGGGKGMYLLQKEARKYELRLDGCRLPLPPKKSRSIKSFLRWQRRRIEEEKLLGELIAPPLFPIFRYSNSPAAPLFFSSTPAGSIYLSEK